MAKTLEGVGHDAKAAVHETGDHMRKAATNMAEKARAAGAELGEELEHSRESLNRAAHSARDYGRNAYENASQHAAHAVEDIDRLVTRNPTGALITALGVGFLIGLMVRK